MIEKKLTEADYKRFAKEYSPNKGKVNTLLIGEAPPPDGYAYFYKVPYKYPIRNCTIENDTSLPATIFNHYFGKRPNDSNEYKKYLACLKDRGIFLIDIYNKAIPFRNRPENIPLLKAKSNLDKLAKRIIKISNTKTTIIFLLARSSYLKDLRINFPNASFINWKCFRLDITQAQQC